jgi:hypothetical protein
MNYYHRKYYVSFFNVASFCPNEEIRMVILSDKFMIGN